MGSLVQFKRNQIEDAIGRLLEPETSPPSTLLRTRIKRLLDTDRETATQPEDHEADAAPFAFYGAASPGRGVEVKFSSYEAYAVFLGVRLLQQGWPQLKVVRVMRRVRPSLAPKHRAILKKDPAQLFDDEAIRAAAKPGDLYWGTTDPLLMIIAAQNEWDAESPSLPDVSIAPNLSGPVAGPMTIIELVVPAWRLAWALEDTSARRRGPGSGTSRTVGSDSIDD